MFSIFLLFLLVAGDAIKQIDAITRRDDVLLLDDPKVNRRDLSNIRLLPRMMATKPRKQAAKSESRTSSPSRSSPSLPPPSLANLPPVSSISRNPQTAAQDRGHKTDEQAKEKASSKQPIGHGVVKEKKEPPADTGPSTSRRSPYQKNFDPLAPIRKDPLYPKAEEFQKKLGLDKHLKPYDLTQSASDIIKHERWQNGVESRVADAKSRATPGQRYQPMNIDKAKAKAKEARTKADQEYRDLSAWKPSEYKSSSINRIGKAEDLAHTDSEASSNYAKQHEKAALKAKYDNRWNDVARHEQSMAREKTRSNLREARMKVLTNKNWVALNHLGGSNSDEARPASVVELEKHKKGRYDAELKIAGAQYQQARERFSGSDSEEELPKSPRD